MSFTDTISSSPQATSFYSLPLTNSKKISNPIQVQPKNTSTIYEGDLIINNFAYSSASPSMAHNQNDHSYHFLNSNVNTDSNLNNLIEQQQQQSPLVKLNNKIQDFNDNYNNKQHIKFQRMSTSPNSTSTNSNRTTTTSLQSKTCMDNVSGFISLDEIIMNEENMNKNESLVQLLSDAYKHDGTTMENLKRMLSFHPDFLGEFTQSHSFLMYSQGPLSFDRRHFIAIMAASRHKCLYLVRHEEKEFLTQNGPKRWLQNGLEALPQKLKDLVDLNKLLCHQPWLINRDHIEKMLKGRYSWSLTELILAVTIMSKFHALSGFVHGCGINENYLNQLQYEENIKKNEQALADADASQSKAAAAAAAALLKQRQYHEDFDSDLSTDGEEESQLFEFSNHNQIAESPPSENSNNNNKQTRSRSCMQSSSTSPNLLDEMNEQKSIGRARSDSTGTSNRTLSNSSSSSSCELGIDMLLKEMQMIKADAAAEKQRSSHDLVAPAAVSATIDILNANNKSVSKTSSLQIMNNNNIKNGGGGGFHSFSNSHNNFVYNNKINKRNASKYKLSTSLNSQIGFTYHARNTHISGSNAINNSHISTSVNTNSTYLSDLSNCSQNTSNNKLHNNNNNNNEVSTQQKSNSHCHSHTFSNSKFNSKNGLNSGLSPSNLVDENNDEIYADSSDLDEFECDDEFQQQEVFSSDANNNNVKVSNNLKVIHNRAHHHNTNKKVKVTANDAAAQRVKMNKNTNQISSFCAKLNKSMSKYVHDPDFPCLDFKNSDQSLKLEYYTWETHGYVTANNIYPEISVVLDKNFKIAGNMTYNTMGSRKDVDTSLFRRAVWHYIHSLFGIRQDDYDYKQLRKLLAKPLRTYIKVLCSCPERIQKADYDSIMKEFTHSEKVHVNILIMEARIQASMLYFLRAVNSYINSTY